jgi:hypothetical protein
MIIVLHESQLQCGLVCGCMISSAWRSRVAGSHRVPVMMCLLLLMCAILFCFAAPLQGFVAYNCANGSNVVEAYSLLEPSQCSASGFEHRFKRVVQVEIVQQNKEKTIGVFWCHVVKSVFSHVLRAF